MCTTPLSDTSELDTFSHKSKSQSHGASQLIRAAVENDLSQVVSLLLESGVPVNAKVRGTTALHETAKAGHVSIVQELITRRAEANAKNRSGCTALHFATLCKDKSRAIDILQFLIESSSQVNNTSERMDTPLHFAAYCQEAENSEEVVRYLLSKRAMVNARNRNAESPLINAALNNNAAAAKVLVEYNADIGQRTSMEKTAQDIAMERGCKEVVDVLEKMKDPLAQLTDTTALMRTALSQMQTVDMLSGQLRQQTLLTEAYESVAAATVAELEVQARARMAAQALSAFEIRAATRDQSSLAPAHVPLSQQQLMQALISLLLISRTASGGAILHKAGVMEVIPNVEEQVRRHNTGHRELRELKNSLREAQVELLELSAELSCSSTPSSIADQWAHSAVSMGPSTPSTSATHTTLRHPFDALGETITALRTPLEKEDNGSEVTRTGALGGYGSEGTIQNCETPSLSSFGDSAEVGRPATGSDREGKGSRRRIPSWTRKSGRPAATAPCTPRKNLPLIGDDNEDDIEARQKQVKKPLSGGVGDIAPFGTAFDSVLEAQAQSSMCLQSSGLSGTASQGSSATRTSTHSHRSTSPTRTWVKRWVDMGEGFPSQKSGSPVRERESSVSDLPTKTNFDAIPQEEDVEAEAREAEARETSTVNTEVIKKLRERHSRMCLVS